MRECSCLDRFRGERCELEMLTCDELVCQNGGKCVLEKYGATCACAEMFTGKHCETEIDPCSSTPCHHGRYKVIVLILMLKLIA